MTKDFLRVGTNTIVQIAARLVTTVSTLAVTILVTRHLSQSDWGVFITITSYVALFYLMVDFGLNSIVVRELESHKGRLDEYFGNLLTIRISLSILASFLALAILSFTNHSSVIKIGIIIGIVTILTLALFNTGVAVFQHKLRYDQVALADISGALVTLVLSYLLITSGFSIIFIVVAYAVGGLVRAFISLYLSSAYTHSIRLRFDFDFSRHLLITALPIGLTLVFSQLAANIDKQIIYLADYNSSLNLNNEEAAGYYGLAYRIFEFGIIIPAFFVNSIYPLLIRDQKKNLTQLKKSFFQYGKILSLGSIIVTILVFTLSPFLISIFGDYGSSVHTLRILSLGYIFFYVTPLLMWTAVSFKKEKLLPFVFGFAFLLNLASNLYFVPKFGFNAAAFVTVVTEMFILACLIMIVVPLLKEFKADNENSN